MHYSGILVTCFPRYIYSCVRELSKLRGVDVYQTDPATGRIVVVLESDTVAGQESGLRDLQSLAHVVTAELVYHYFGEDAAGETMEPLRSNP